MKRFYVYAHYTLDTNELFYIGKGKQNRFLDRWGRNNYWHNIVNKHNFRGEILVSNLEEADAFIQEILAIKEYSPRANFTKGGSGGYTGPNSGQFKKNSIPWNKNKKCLKISNRQFGVNNPMYGKKNLATSKRVKLINNDMVFSTVKECIKYCKISKSGFHKSIKEAKPIKGFRFKYV